jgi:hypothetical protein
MTTSPLDELSRVPTPTKIRRLGPKRAHEVVWRAEKRYETWIQRRSQRLRRLRVRDAQAIVARDEQAVAAWRDKLRAARMALRSCQRLARPMDRRQAEKAFVRGQDGKLKRDSFGRLLVRPRRLWDSPVRRNHSVAGSRRASRAAPLRSRGSRRRISTRAGPDDSDPHLATPDLEAELQRGSDALIRRWCAERLAIHAEQLTLEVSA